jgi:F0F1-type ATP synthase membrane subunit b/b'
MAKKKTKKNKAKNKHGVLYFLSGKWLNGFVKRNMGVFLIIILLLIAFIWKSYSYKKLDKEIKTCQEEIKHQIDDKNTAEKKLGDIKTRESDVEKLLQEKGSDIKSSKTQATRIPLTNKNTEDGE